VKPAAFVAKYGQSSDATEDLSKKKKLSQTEIGKTLKERWNIQPPVNCQGCHR
jgi:antitoxin component HigA of HigAB toxin-antitoxin module